MILSESEFLASLELDRLRAHYTAKGFTVEEIASTDPQALFYALDTPSLFGEGRLVVVRGTAAELEPSADRLAAWAESPPEGIVAALVLGRAAKLKKAVGARADVIEAEPPKPWETAEWVVRFMKSRGRLVKKDAAEALIDAVGTNLREVATAAEQLMMSTTGGISVDTVTRMFRGMESALYTFLDALLARDRSSALKHVSALMRSGYHPLQIMNTLSKQFRALAAIKEGVRPNPAALAKEIDVTPGAVSRAQKHGRNFDAAEVRRAFRLLADADLALKGGERGEDQPPELVMELLVSELTGDPRAAAGARRG